MPSSGGATCLLHESKPSIRLGAGAQAGLVVHAGHLQVLGGQSLKKLGCCRAVEHEDKIRIDKPAESSWRRHSSRGTNMP